MPGLPAPARVVCLAALVALAAAPLAAEERDDPPAEAEEREILLAQADDATDEELSDAELDAALEDSGGPPAGVEVLRVRGRGIAAIQTEVPASVTSFDAATIEALGAQDVSDLSRVTPNVSIVQPGATQANFFIRGIGLSDFSANSQGAVTIFQDDVAVNAPAIQTGQLFDIGGVDIVRGPQGYGPFRNASAGAIRVNSNLPSGNYGGMIRASLGQYWAEDGKGARDALIQDYEGYFETPLVEDLLSTRLAFRLRDTDPYKTNGCGNNIPFSSPPRLIRTSRNNVDGAICGERGVNAGEMFPLGEFTQIPKGLPRKIDYEDNWAARGFLRINPPDTDVDIVLNAHGSRLDQDQAYGQAIGVRRVQRRGSPFGGTAVTGYHEPDQQRELERFCEGLRSCPADILTRFEKKLAEDRPLDEKPFRGDFNKDGLIMRDAYGGYARAEGKWNDLDLFFLASYDGYERDRDQDTDLVPDFLFEQAEVDESWQTYEELSVGGELAAAPFEWEVGGYYLHEELESDSRTQVFQGAALERAYEQITDSWGVWGQFKWDILDDWTLEGGMRFNWERKDFEISRETFGPGGRPLRSAESDETWSTPTGGLVLTYHFDERASAFAKYSRGFKAGHFNGVAGQDLDIDPADPEFNDAIEAGLQGAWLDGRLSMLAAAFYYRYKDYQVFLFRDQVGDPPVLEIINADEAENYGIEIEGRLEPLRGWVPRAIEGLMVTWNFSWLHGEFLDFAFTTEFSSGGNVLPFTIDFSGDQLLSSPEFKFSGSVAWTLDLGRYGYIIPRYDFNWSDDIFYGVNEGRGAGTPRGVPRLPDFAIGQEAYWLHNVRLTYRTPTTNVELAFWVRNIEDTVYKTFAFDASNFSGVVLNFVGEPRTWGGDITFRFP